MLYLDLETRSDVDLIFHGLRRYAIDPSTEVICMAYALDDDPVEFWWSFTGEDGIIIFPQEVEDYIEAGGFIMAHNAAFEKHIFDRVISDTHGITPPTNEQWRCSMAIGLTNGYAGGLDALAAGLGLSYRKNPQGARLIREYCAPGHLKTFKPGDADVMRDYCISDVETMRAAVKCLRDLTPMEWEEYHINAVINDRGLPIDVAFCDAALGYTREVADDANEQISRLTGGLMTKATQRNSRDAWLFPKLTPHQMDLLTVYKKGVKKFSLDQDHRRYLLECGDLDHDARELLEYIDNAGSSALKKFAVASHQHVEGRVHNTFLFNGAGRTGRFSGKGLQPHNIRRDVFSHNEAESLIQDVVEGLEIDRPANTMARLLRAMISHPDGLYWVDWSSIEGRVAPWLSNSREGNAKLELFKQGRDIYVVTAADMANIPEDKVDGPLRQSGKIAELSLQFGGSHNALIGMAKNYGITFEENEARSIVDRWRIVNPWAQQIWREYDKAITDAVLTPGTDCAVGRVAFHSDGLNFLWCMLPSKRLLSYPKPKFEPYMTPWHEERIGVTFQSHFKPAAGEPPIRIHARGALLFQNTVQAVAADCLREAVVLAHDEGLEIVGHVHDEIIGLGDRAEGERLNNIMLEEPWWADGLPLNTGGVSHGTRYGK
jgi:DNA polymerase